MGGIVFPSIGNAILPLIQMDRQAEESRLNRDRLTEESRLNRERLDRHDQWMQQDRAEARGMQKEQRALQLDAAKRAQLKDAAEATTQAALGVLNTPEAERPAAYQTALNYLKSRGHDTANLPPQYSSGMDGMLRFYVQKAQSVNDYLKQQADSPQAMPAPGGGAPGAPGGTDIDRSGTAISGIESGGKYDALGPMTGGDRAYGKYQVMGANIPTWTQEALGRPMTPQEFMANPQAQDAVFRHKFGQYIQQYGSPEAASRAWFAGPGGMNNPNAKDVLGTSVASYAEKFNKGYGGPQVASGGGFTPTNTPAQSVPGALPQVPQGDAVAGQGDVMAPPRAAPPTIGNEIDDLRRQTRASGGDIFTVKGQAEIQNGHYVVRSLQNPRQIIGMIPLPDKPAAPPSGYQLPGAGLRYEEIPGGPAERERLEKQRAAAKYTGPTGPFAGNNPDVQAFNYLVSTGRMTVEQAANVLGGKSITNPADGSVIFVPATQLAGAGASPPAASAGAAEAGAPSPNAAQGSIPLTPPKKELALKKLETEVRAVESSIANFQKVITEAGGGSWRAFINDPTSPDAQKVLGAFNALKTALRSEAFVNTGVLQPAEMTMLDNMLLSPQSVRGAFTTPESYAAMLGQIELFVKNKMDAASVAYGQPTPKAAAPSAAGPPKVGDTQDGYLYKGGDPSQPSSWEKVR